MAQIRSMSSSKIPYVDGYVTMSAARCSLCSVALATTAISAAKPGSVQAQTSTNRPGFFGAKDSAEAGFIYGLPIVMNYGVMYEYAVDRNSGQFKAPFNQIKNEPNVFTYKDTAIPTPNSDTPMDQIFGNADQPHLIGPALAAA